MSFPAALFIANRILCSPLEVLFTLLIFILSKNLNASPLQLTIVACLKPITSFFAFYASSVIFDKPQRIRSYLIINNMIGCVPCFLYPFIDHVWFFIASYGVFMITMRAAYPAWIETLKGKTDSGINALGRVVSQGTSIYYFITIALPPLICWWMDNDEGIWRILFAGFAVVQAANNAAILLIPKHSLLQIKFERVSTHAHLIEPLKQGWAIFKEKPAFAHYQILFFLGGAGIIGIQPILPIYFNENMHLSYTQLALAFSLCKGISYILTSPSWSKWANRLSIYYLNSVVDLFTCLYIACILGSNFGVEWLFPAYLFYGTMQAGCEMSWNLSGPIFAGSKESTIYSSLNLAVVGIRGCICPVLGHVIYMSTNANTVFTAGFVICLIALFYGLWLDRVYCITSKAEKETLVKVVS